MPSINAENTARDISESIRKRKPVKLGKILLKNGYSKSTSEKPRLVTQTKSFKKVMDPIIAQMIKERERLILAMASKNLSKEKYRDMVDGFDKFTKNIQLLSGEETGDNHVTVHITNYGDKK